MWVVRMLASRLFCQVKYVNPREWIRSMSGHGEVPLPPEEIFKLECAIKHSGHGARAAHR